MPNDPALRGGRLLGQWATAEPGGPVLGQLALSSGLSIVIGG